MLHSLDLAQRGTGPLGEADFVVIAPGFGVMVIEAKTYLARTPAGEWLTHPQGPPKERGPFLCLSIEKLTTSITEKLTTPSLSTSAVS